MTDAAPSPPLRRRLARGLGRGLVAVAVLLLLAPALLPPFLDRIYYRGPVTGHFDGERFHNPGGNAETPAPPGGGSRSGFLMRRVLGSGARPEWPTRVAVTPTRPPTRVAGTRMLVTWVGHATVLVQTQGINILTDPVWSERAGPFGLGPRRVADPGIRFEDLPPIDLVLVSHNHYDHLDLATLKRLWARDRPRIVTSLGNDAVIDQAGVPAQALDWSGAATLPGGAQVVVTRNHHWGSRWFADRNRALWSSFVVRLPGGNLFFAGDTGFGDGAWPAEARALGPIRLAIVPIGAFRFRPGQMGTDSHIGPGEAAMVFERLGARHGLPIHWGTFRLSDEAWDTPPRMLRMVNRCLGIADGRFEPRGIGQSFVVPLVYTGETAAPSGRGRLDRCLSLPDIKALQ